MANSITLSQSLVDDIAQKITDGTATAEQVVLYTKGLNQLQTGNDFQSVVIGLSQSAVDAIDSANAQFQEDTQNALDTFSQTATNIDTSATNAVSAINTAKDTLVATDAEITSTINALPSKSSIEESQKWSIHEYGISNGQSGYTPGAGSSQNAPNWDGVHDLPRIWKGYVEHKEFDLIHPWNAPAYLTFSHLSGQNGLFSVRNSYDEIMDQIGVTIAAVDDTAAGTAYMMHKYRVHWGYHSLTTTHGYVYDYIGDSPGSSSGQRINGTTQLGPYGQGRYMAVGEAWRGLSEGFVYTTNTTGNNDRRASSMGYGTIVGTTHKDWTITRPWADHRVYLSSSRKIADAHYTYMNRSEFETDSGYSPFSDGTQFTEKSKIDVAWGKGYTGDWIRHERFRFNSFRGTGMGNISYNGNTNKFLYVDVNSGSPYEKQLKLMSVDSSFNLRNIALGKQSIGQQDYDPISNSKMTLEIDSQVDMRAAADAVTSIGRTDSYDDHIGQAVLCDNDTVVMAWQYTHGTNKFRIVRAIKNSSNSDYQYDTQWNRTLNVAYQDYDFYGPTHRVTNDGRYVAIFTHDYYYGGGINGVFVRVSDGAVLQYEVHNTGTGVYVVPTKHDEFYVGYQINTNHRYRLSMDYMFENFADGTDVSNQFFKGTQHAEYSYQYGIQQKSNHDRRYNTSIFPIYQPYNYLTQYYNTDGTKKSEYDRNLNLIS